MTKFTTRGACASPIKHAETHTVCVRARAVTSQYTCVMQMESSPGPYPGPACGNPCRYQAVFARVLFTSRRYEHVDLRTKKLLPIAWVRIMGSRFCFHAVFVHVCTAACRCRPLDFHDFAVFMTSPSNLTQRSWWSTPDIWLEFRRVLRSS